VSARDVPGNTELGPWDSVYGPLLPTRTAPAVSAADERVERVVREALASEATGLVVDAIAAMDTPKPAPADDAIHQAAQLMASVNGARGFGASFLDLAEALAAAGLLAVDTPRTVGAEHVCTECLCYCGQLPQACTCDRGVDRAEGFG